MDAKRYSELNKPQLGFAQKLIELIGKFGKESQYETIIDIGPGPGNTTKLLATQVEHGKIFALDIDPNMIEFAKKVQTLDSIEFLLNDLSGDWNSIDEKMKQLESKVSLVFSNACIGYIKQKSTFVENLKRLMIVDAKAYLSVILFPDLNNKLKGELKEKFGKFVEIPTFVKQMQFWADIFEDNGFTVEYNNIQSTESQPVPFGDWQVLRPIIPVFLDIYMKNGMQFNELPDDIKETLAKLYIDQMTNWNTKSINWQKFDQDRYNEEITANITVGYIVVKRNK